MALSFYWLSLFATTEFLVSLLKLGNALEALAAKQNIWMNPSVLTIMVLHMQSSALKTFKVALALALRKGKKMEINSDEKGGYASSRLAQPCLGVKAYTKTPHILLNSVPLVRHFLIILFALECAPWGCYA
eukprot:4426889-Amphidinium_carterae.1